MALTAMAGSMMMTSCKIVKKETAVRELFGPTITKSYEIGQFKDIELNGGADVVFRKGAPSLRIEAPEKVLKLIRVINNHGRLIIIQKEPRIHEFVTTDCEVRIICTSPEINGIVLNGTGDLDIDSLETEQIHVEINGTGDVTYSNGHVGVFDVSLNGTGDLDMENVSGGQILFTLTGTGDADMKGIDFDMVSVDISGVGDVDISGKARNAVLNNTGTGEIDIEKFSCPDIKMSTDGAGKITR